MEWNHIHIDRCISNKLTNHEVLPPSPAESREALSGVSASFENLVLETENHRNIAAAKRIFYASSWTFYVLEKNKCHVAVSVEIEEHQIDQTAKIEQTAKALMPAMKKNPPPPFLPGSSFMQVEGRYMLSRVQWHRLKWQTA